MTERDDQANRALGEIALARWLYRDPRDLFQFLAAHSNQALQIEAERARNESAEFLERMQQLLYGESQAVAEAEARAETAEDEGVGLILDLRAEEKRAAQLEQDLEETRAKLSLLSQNSSSLERMNRELDSRLKTLESDHKQLQRELEEAKTEKHKAELKLGTYSALIAQGDVQSKPPVDYEAPPAATLSGVIEVAREQCELVEIHQAAPREIDALEADEGADVWARELWKGLRALNAYAGESEHFSGGFWEWCEHSNHQDNVWPASEKKLAMSESDTVRNNARLNKARNFNIDRKVEPRGYIHMYAHLKIVEGGGQHIPRLYFHDDTGGRSGKIHIGFIGPHRLVPNTTA